MNKSNNNILKLILLMAFADLKFQEDEKIYILELCKKLKINNETYTSILKDIKKSTDFFINTCRETAKSITEKKDRESAIQLLSEMMAKDKVVHKTEIFVLQLIAEEWGMFVK